MYAEASTSKAAGCSRVKAKTVAELEAVGDPGSTPQESAENVEPENALIDTLKGNGITDDDLSRLKKAGYYTVKMVAQAHPKKLKVIHGLSEAKAEKIHKAAIALTPMGFSVASMEISKREKVRRLGTGSKSLDEILGGGLECGSLFEVYGEARAGKSQLIHQLLVNSLLPIDKGGLNAKSMILDTNNTFRPERIVAMATHLRLDVDMALENVVYQRVYNTDHLLASLNDAAALLSEGGFGLLAVDCATALYRVEYVGRGELSERQGHLGQFLRKLSSIATQFNVCVVVTNEVTAVVDGMTFGETKKAIGGYVLSHMTKTRVMLKKGSGEKRVCSLINSPHLPSKDCVFGIYAHGIGDLE